MKVIGGNFGLGGGVSIRDGVLLVGTDKGTYTFDSSEIKSISSMVSTEKNFGCVSFLLGAIILGIIFGLFLSIFGILIGVILAAAGSWYKVENYEATIGVTNDRTVTVSCSKRDIKKLMLLTP